MKFLFEKQAAKRLARVRPALRQAFIAALSTIAAYPLGSHADVKQLKGDVDLYRLRHGDWRVIYRVVQSDDAIRVLIVDTRGGVYK